MCIYQHNEGLIGSIRIPDDRTLARSDEFWQNMASGWSSDEVVQSLDSDEPNGGELKRA